LSARRNFWRSSCRASGSSANWRTRHTKEKFCLHFLICAHPRKIFLIKEKSILLGSALNEQAAGLCGLRSDGSAFLPPTPSCRAVLAGIDEKGKNFKKSTPNRMVTNRGCHLDRITAFFESMTPARKYSNSPIHCSNFSSAGVALRGKEIFLDNRFHCSYVNACL